MKKMLVLITLALATTLTACSAPPNAEMDAARAAIDTVVSEGAEKYTADDLKAINDKLAGAMAEIKAQEGKLFKKFDQPKQILVEVKADADTLRGKVATVKEELKNAAVAALQEAGNAVAEAKTMVDNAPIGKGSLADIEMIKADVAGLETALQEIQPLIDNGDFAAASEQAAAIQGKAQSVSEEIRVAQAKAEELQIAKKK